MKVKKMVKRILAVGAGATMLGATVMGAVAADLKDYPDMFVSDGTFNGLLVVGENAAAVDNLALTDIASSMKYLAPGDSTSVTVEGDAWLAKSGSDVLEIGEPIGPAASGVVDFLDDEDLAALADGELKNSKGTFTYEQFLHFDEAQINVTYEEDDDDVTDLFVKLPDNRLFARYEMDFIEAAESDIDASDSFELDDYEGKELTMMGKTFDIVKAVTGGANSHKMTLTLMAGSVQDTLNEGESKTYSIGGKDYDLELTFTDSNNQAKFMVNGEVTSLLTEGETFTLADGTVLGISEVLYQDYAGGIHSTEFFLGADKVELEDDNVSTAGSTDELKVNEETIDGADVTITGTMLDFATSTTEDGEIEIDSIEINMTAQDDYYVAAGEMLSEQPELEEKELLFSQNWDLQYEGLSGVATNVISVKDRNGEKEYELTFTNVNGDVMKIPFVYAISGATMRLGDSDDTLLLNNSDIKDEYYFILNDDTDEDSVTNVVQYKGANVGSESTTLKFKVLASGETVERNFDTSTNTSTLKLSGTTYTVTAVTNQAVDDFNISVTGGSTTAGTTNASTLTNGGRTDYLIAKGGAKIYLTDPSDNTTTDQIQYNISLIDSDRIDDVRTVSGTAPYLVYGANITAASQELDQASRVGISLISPEDNDDVSQGYSDNGAWVVLTSSSGGGTSADTVSIDWPEDERTPQVFITSGATSSSVSGEGTLKAVTIVDATKLDSEVASLTAQNVIMVGGPCVNTLAAEALGNPADCTEGFTPGKARIKLWTHANGNVAMLVAGFSGADTRLAGKVVSHRADELTGTEVEVEGTTYTDASIGAPASSGDAMEDKSGDAMEADADAAAE